MSSILAMKVQRGTVGDDLINVVQHNVRSSLRLCEEVYGILLYMF